MTLSQQRIRELQESFDSISIEHIYMNFNHRDDSLSKQAISLVEGLLVSKELHDEEALPEVQ